MTARVGSGGGYVSPPSVVFGARWRPWHCCRYPWCIWIDVSRRNIGSMVVQAGSTVTQRCMCCVSGRDECYVVLAWKPACLFLELPACFWEAQLSPFVCFDGSDDVTATFCRLKYKRFTLNSSIKAIMWIKITLCNTPVTWGKIIAAKIEDYTHDLNRTMIVKPDIVSSINATRHLVDFITKQILFLQLKRTKEALERVSVFSVREDQLVLFRVLRAPVWHCVLLSLSKSGMFIGGPVTGLDRSLHYWILVQAAASFL